MSDFSSSMQQPFGPSQLRDQWGNTYRELFHSLYQSENLSVLAKSERPFLSQALTHLHSRQYIWLGLIPPPQTSICPPGILIILFLFNQASVPSNCLRIIFYHYLSKKGSFC